MNLEKMLVFLLDFRPICKAALSQTLSKSAMGFLEGFMVTQRWDLGDSQWDQGDSRWDQGDSRWDQGGSRWDQGYLRWDQGSAIKKSYSFHHIAKTIYEVAIKKKKRWKFS